MWAILGVAALVFQAGVFNQWKFMQLLVVAVLPGHPFDSFRRPLYMSTKNTILKQYDGRFLQIFQEIYEQVSGSHTSWYGRETQMQTLQVQWLLDGAPGDGV